MRPDIAHFVRSWDPCQKTNPPEQSIPYGKIRIGSLFHTWSIDFEGPLKETKYGNKHLLLAEEDTSCWPVACAIGKEMFTGAGVIRFVEEQIRWLYGNPVCIVSDGNSKLDIGTVRDVATCAGIHLKVKSSYNLSGNAKVERMVVTLKRALQKVAASTRSQIGMCALEGYSEVIGDGPVQMESLRLKKPHIIVLLQLTVSLFVGLRSRWLNL